MAPKIFVVEDERDLVEVLEYNLKREGYLVESAARGADVLRRILAKPPPDLVLLDLMLPDIQGEEICRQLRSTPQTRHLPIIMLTAKGEEIDRVVGFELGADDYVVKPFSIRELLLRIKALLRRTADSPRSEGKKSFGCLTVDAPAHKVAVNGEEVTLTALEFRLLETFFERRGRAQSREVLLQDVWDIRADVTTRTVDTHVKRLREKLGDAGRYIETIRGVGYRFSSEAD
jgi:two-component system phosphate regulon response regulator PhoB